MRRILLVDDDELVTDAIASVLDEHEVIATTSAEDALEIVRSGAEIDLVICDITLEGASGLELFEAIRSIRPELERHFVFMTGGAEAGDHPLIPKPFSVEILRAVVTEHLRA